jgi:hypothetical protein
MTDPFNTNPVEITATQLKTLKFIFSIETDLPMLELDHRVLYPFCRRSGYSQVINFPEAGLYFPNYYFRQSSDPNRPLAIIALSPLTDRAFDQPLKIDFSEYVSGYEIQTFIELLGYDEDKCKKTLQDLTTNIDNNKNFFLEED